MFKSGVMDVPRTIHCDSFWDVLVLSAMLEEQGVQVRRPAEGVALSMVTSGALDAIKAAVAQLHREFPRAGPVVIRSEDHTVPAVTGSEDHAEPAVTGTATATAFGSTATADDTVADASASPSLV